MKSNLRQRVEFGYMTGVVVGLVNRDGRDYFSAGRLHADGGEMPGPDTPFEIGSVTKVFTSTLLAEMTARGEVTLDTPVQSLLPATVTVPMGTPEITLKHLATHRSGLPTNPDNPCSKSLHNYFACFDTQRLHEFLNQYTLNSQPGTVWEYSNVGVGLLGHALAWHAGGTFENLLRQRLLDPLGLADTRITLSPAQQSRRAGGHWGDVPWPEFVAPGIEGAGSLVSTAADLLTFLEHVSGLKTNVLGAVATETTRRHAAGGSAGVSMGLGWLLVTLPGGEVVEHDGATFGQNSFVGFHRSSRRGVVVLCNNRLSTYGSATDIGLHLLDANIPLNPPRRPATVAPATLASYAGRYQAGDGPAYDAEVRHGRLALNFSGDGSPGFTVHAESATRFGAYEFGVNGSAVFVADQGGFTLRWTQGGVTTEFSRVAVPGRLEIARTGGEVRLRLEGTPGYNYELESSPDLRGWTKRGPHAAGEAAWFVPPALESPKGFYRAVLPALE